MLLRAVGAVCLASLAGPTRFGGSGGVGGCRSGAVVAQVIFPKRVPEVTHSGVLCEEIAPKEHHLELLSHRTGVFHQPCCLDIKIHNEVVGLEICTRHAVLTCTSQKHR